MIKKCLKYKAKRSVRDATDVLFDIGFSLDIGFIGLSEVISDICSERTVIIPFKNIVIYVTLKHQLEYKLHFVLLPI